MSTFTEELRSEIERVTLKGNADKVTIQKLASIIWRMEQRIEALEELAKKEPKRGRGRPRKDESGE